MSEHEITVVLRAMRSGVGDAAADEIERLRALADELAAALARSVPSLIHDPETEAVMARFREARQRSRSDDEIRDAIRMEGDIG